MEEPPVTVNEGEETALNTMPFTEFGVIAPNDIDIAGVVVALVTVPETPLTAFTVTVVTVPPLLVEVLVMVKFGYVPVTLIPVPLFKITV